MKTKNLFNNEMQEFAEFLQTTKSHIDPSWKGSSTITKRGNSYSLKLTYYYDLPSGAARLVPGDWVIKCSTIEKAKLKQKLFNQSFANA